MFKEIYKVVYFIIILLFVYLLFAIYFSEENIKKIKKNRVNIENSFKDYLSNLPILENDTNDVIIYNSSEFLEKKIKKRKFWELLKKNE
ncbi:MAG: hypothetical protein HVK29_01145 [Pelagibacteraceae bacterium]|nr:hypothetical protein [Pelagibacteraceae bacterium]|tara:strand:+ start:612 stop:878 length:267 start_codon:yes stop_codon:yes gene_type:complete